MHTFARQVHEMLLFQPTGRLLLCYCFRPTDLCETGSEDDGRTLTDRFDIYSAKQTRNAEFIGRKNAIGIKLEVSETEGP